MNIRQWILIAALLVLAATGGFLLARHFREASFARDDGDSAVGMLAIGDRRPDLVLLDPNGQPVPLSRYDGKPLLLNFWASWCPPCVGEMPVFDAFAARRTDVQVVGVAVEPIEAVRDHLAAHPVAYPILVGSEGTRDESWVFGNGRGVLPYTVLIGADGRIVKRHAGAFDADMLDRWVP